MFELRRPAFLFVALASLALAGCRFGDGSGRNQWLLGEGAQYEQSYDLDGRLSTRVLARADGRELVLEAKGAIEFSDDDREFRLTQAGQSISLRERKGGDERAWAATYGAEPNWKVDGQPAPIDARTGEWLAARVLEIVRTTPLGAEQRAARIVRDGGVDALLREFELLQSARAQSIYLGQLNTLEGVQADDLVRAVEACGESRMSTSDRGDFYAQTAKAAANDAAVTRAMLDSAALWSSSSEQARVLRALIAPSARDPQLSARWLAAADKVSSAATRSEVLLELLAELPGRDEVLARWLGSVRGISSGSSRERLCLALASRPDCSAPTLREITRQLREEPLTSSSQARVLRAVLASPQADQGTLAAAITTASSISSSTESAATLLAALEHPAADRAVLEEIARAAERLSSAQARESVQTALIQRLLALPPASN